MALPPSWVSWLKQLVDTNLPTNTTGRITAATLRDTLHQYASKSDPLPYVQALKSMVAEDLASMQQALLVKIAELDNKADQISLVANTNAGDIQTLNGEVVGIKNDVSDLKQSVTDLTDAISGLDERVTALENSGS